LEQSRSVAETPAILFARTLRAAVSPSLNSASVSAHVAALAKSGIAVLGAAKLKLVVSLVVMLGVLMAGLGLVGLQTLAEKTPPTQAGTPASKSDSADKIPAKNHADRLGDPLPALALARLGTNRLRHGHAVMGIAYTRDGKILASAGQDGS